MQLAQMDVPPSAESVDGQALPLSKNKLKKLKRDQEWEANRARRKEKRREKQIEKKLRKRAADQDPATTAQTNQILVQQSGQEPKPAGSKKSTPRKYVRLPVTVILDCGFEDLMNDKELISLGAQVTRCYSDNHKAPFQPHLAISSFGGHMKERFNGLLNGQYHSWKNVRFLEGDFVQTADEAKEWMKGERGGKLVGALATEDDSAPTPYEQGEAGEVVYLTSDSPDTLTRLRPYSTYIIGGLVDRNRHKGVCYKRALDRGVRTAKLPIGDYMQMASRFVLATNHVAEIMLRWLELGDWGRAFLQVVPKRKGGVLKSKIEGPNDRTDGEALEDGNVESETSKARVEDEGAKTSGGEVGIMHGAEK